MVTAELVGSPTIRLEMDMETAISLMSLVGQVCGRNDNFCKHTYAVYDALEGVGVASETRVEFPYPESIRMK